MRSLGGACSVFILLVHECCSIRFELKSNTGIVNSGENETNETVDVDAALDQQERLEKPARRGRPKPKPSFFLVQMADPQLGLLNMLAEKKEALKIGAYYGDELNNLHSAVKKICQLKPRLVVMSGDMQNAFSQPGAFNMKLDKGGVKNWPLPADPKDPRGRSRGLGDNGDVEAWLVKDVMQRLEDAEIPVLYQPGNHDLADKVIMENITRYTNMWETHDYYSRIIGGVLFISINSQLYFEPANANSQILEAMRAQTQWLAQELQKAQTNHLVTAIVILTHIPPFVGYPTEKHGWGNWAKSSRKAVFNIVYNKKFKKFPALWLCGHFHGNVISRRKLNRKIFDVVTTGSIGASMLWHLKGKKAIRDEDGEYSEDDARVIAGAGNGFFAFRDHIVDGNIKNEETLRPLRVITDPDVSGVRIVQFYTNGQYRHKWFSLNEFVKVTNVDQYSMAGAYVSPNFVF